MQKSSAWLIGVLITIAVGALAAKTDAKPHHAPAPNCEARCIHGMGLQR